MEKYKYREEMHDTPLITNSYLWQFEFWNVTKYLSAN